jgi:hypothetical protein
MMIFGVVFGAVSAARAYLSSAKQEADDSACSGLQGVTHHVTIQDGHAQPESVTAKVCDVLVIENTDNTQRRLAFGEHDHHVGYDGSDGKLVGQYETLTLVLTEAGEFMFHDHFDDRVYGHFTVARE